ncbi:hypothetical protein L1049_001348 [Liquidambar formosana]|uniref:Uncharacterized protein n=1 Tax=Liquidambar formosana TaxID=63359 RepID=A0AAP0NCA7_LIQFO
MGGLVLLLYTSSRPSLMRPFTACLHEPIRRYNQASKENISHGIEERAPSIAQEFQRVAEEKAHQGVASQTIEKAFEAAEEATSGDSNPESVKQKYKKTRGNESHHKTGDD